MASIGKAQYAESKATSEAEIDEILRDVHGLIEFTENRLIAPLAQVSNRLFGEEPQEDECGGPVPVRSGMSGEIRDSIDRLRAKLDAADHYVLRIRAFV